jgi:hypothetical protein
MDNYYETHKPQINEDGSITIDIPAGMTKEQFKNSYISYLVTTKGIDINEFNNQVLKHNLHEKIMLLKSKRIRK